MANEHPEIPSFKPTQKKDEKKGGGLLNLGGKADAPGSLATGPKGAGGFKFPSFGGAQGAGGGLKVRGLPGGSTIVERLRNLRKKDMAFIAAGLSVLMMAPIAEHFMMSPSEESGTLQQGFNERGPLFPDGTTVYEQGTGGFSPGSLLGQGADVITPLNVRDPAALVMGPGATQKPAAGTPAPVSAPPSKKKGGWKDALAQAASKGTKQAVKRSAKLPKPNVKMTGALRGLAALGGLKGGGGPSMKLAAPSASNVPNTARGSDALTRSQAAPGFRGAARRSQSAGGGPESLKAAGSRQSDIFNKGGAVNALDTASQQSMPGGGGYGSGGGGPGADGRRKGPGGNSHKDNRSLGESLAFIRAKKEMEKAIDLKWKKKEWNEFGRKKMIEEAVYKSAIENLLGKGIFEPMGKAIGNAMGSIFPAGAAASGVSCLISGVDKRITNTADNTYSCTEIGGDGAIMTNKDGVPSPVPCPKCRPFGASSGSSTDDVPQRNDNAPTNWTGAGTGYDSVLTGGQEAAANLRTLKAQLEAYKSEVDAAAAAGQGDFRAKAQALSASVAKWIEAADKLAEANAKVEEGWRNNKSAAVKLREALGVAQENPANLFYASAQHGEALSKVAAAYALLVPAEKPDYGDQDEIKADLVYGDGKVLAEAKTAFDRAYNGETHDGGGIVGAVQMSSERKLAVDQPLVSAEQHLAGNSTHDNSAKTRINAAQELVTQGIIPEVEEATFGGNADYQRQWAALISGQAAANGQPAKPGATNLRQATEQVAGTMDSLRNQADTHRRELVAHRADLYKIEVGAPAVIPQSNAVAEQYAGSLLAAVHDVRVQATVQSGTVPGIRNLIGTAQQDGSLLQAFDTAYRPVIAATTESEYNSAWTTYAETMGRFKTANIDSVAGARTTAQGRLSSTNNALIRLENQLRPQD